MLGAQKNVGIFCTPPAWDDYHVMRGGGYDEAGREGRCRVPGT